MDETSESILQRTRDTLSAANLGLRDLEGDDPARRMIGLWNLVVFGRSVTYVLQLMRRVDRLAFDNWYSFFEEEMAADPLMRYFNTLRNSILKEGELQTTATIHMNHLNTADLLPLLSNPPPGASNFFIGDQVGGSGWEIELPHGQSVKYYVQLPSAVRMTNTFHFPEAPTDHLGQPITDNSVPALGRLYLQYLSRLVNSAEMQFSGSGSSESR